MGKWDGLPLTVLIITLGVCTFNLYRIDANQEVRLKQIQLERDRYHQELKVRKLEAEAQIARLRAIELENAAALVDKEGISYSR